MFSRDHLTFEPIPLPDHIDMSDPEMQAASKAFFDTMAKRHTVRDFQTTSVPRDLPPETSFVVM